jgi:glycerol uptake facilitator-like aquaporin
MKISLARRVVAEFFGTAFLVAAVIGSGIMGDRLANGNVVLALLANTIATGAALVALIFAFGGVSGAHFNPVVSLMDAFERGLTWREAAHYVIGQILGGISGAIVAHLMFALPLISFSRHARSGLPQVFSEFVATFGLVSVIWGLFPASIQCCSIRCRRIHHGGLLVHRIYIVCESRCHDCAVSQRHICVHPAHRCSLVRRGSISRGNCSDAALPLARS